MRRLRFGLLGAAGLAVATLVGATLASPSGGSVEAAFETARALRIDATAIPALDPRDPGRRRFGDLEFLGGLVLASRDSAFGGLSGLATFDRGTGFLAVGDEGSWVTGRIVLDEKGAPTGIENASIAPLLDERGHPFRGKHSRDAESLALHRTGTGWEAHVGFERRHRVLAYHAEGAPAALLAAPGRPTAVPVEIGRLASNEGLEALAVAPVGSPLVMIAEEPFPGEKDNPGWIVGGRDAGRFHLTPADGFAVSDAAFLPNGDLLVLERRLSLFGLFSARIVRIAGADLAPGRTLVGTPVWQSEAGGVVDNMEGLAVDTAADGSILLTLVSDDNFFWLQRTLLMRFRLVENRAERPPG